MTVFLGARGGPRHQGNEVRLGRRPGGGLLACGCGRRRRPVAGRWQGRRQMRKRIGRTPVVVRVVGAQGAGCAPVQRKRGVERRGCWLFAKRERSPAAEAVFRSLPSTPSGSAGSARLEARGSRGGVKERVSPARVGCFSGDCHRPPAGARWPRALPSRPEAPLVQARPGEPLPPRNTPPPQARGHPRAQPQLPRPGGGTP